MAEIEIRPLDQETWYQNKWRPSIGWSYMTICLFDFLVGPILWTLAQLQLQGVDISALTKWEPLTLQHGGLYHFAMMAIVGVTAYGRTKEKIEATMRDKV